MVGQRDRQLKRYQKFRPIDTPEYKEGYWKALSDLRNGEATSSNSYHLDSGRHLRWSMGYQDALYYLAQSMYKMHCHKLNEKVHWINHHEELSRKLEDKESL